MTTISPRLEPDRGAGMPRPIIFHAYAGVCAVLGIDLLLFGDWIAGWAIATPILAATIDFGTYARVLGAGCILFAATIALTARRGGDWAALCPAMAGVAGVLSILGALVGLSVLTPSGATLLLVVGGVDLLFMVLMRRALTA